MQLLAAIAAAAALLAGGAFVATLAHANKLARALKSNAPKASAPAGSLPAKIEKAFLEPDAPSDDGLNDLLGKAQGQAQNVVQQRLEDYLSGRLSDLAALLGAQSGAMRSLAAVGLVDPDHRGQVQQADSWSKVAERAKHLLDDAADLDVRLAPAMKATHGQMLAQQPMFASIDEPVGDNSARLNWMLEHRFANDEPSAQRTASEIASYQRHASMSDMNLRLQRLDSECRRCRTLLATLNAVSALQ